MTPSAKPRILLLSAYDAGSHRRWREQLVASQPEFEWHILTLPPRFFRWRIRGNALSWLNEPLLQQPWDLVMATSMVDLTSIRGFHPRLARVPALLYMHENQFAYPDSGRQHASADHQIVNLYSAIAADQVLFNSDWNRSSFLSQAGGFLDRLPDAKPEGLLTTIAEKSLVVPVPIDDRLFLQRDRPLHLKLPHLLWNHRWEYDKGPDRLLALLQNLDAAGQPFRLSVVGEQFRRQPESFELVRQGFGDRLESFGYLPDRSAYDRLLTEADVVLSTALHDFQGLSMLEAMASGCLALAPDRLAYPEYVPPGQCYQSHENDPEKEAESAADALLELLNPVPAQPAPDAWRLSVLQPRYRDILDGLIGSVSSH